MEDWEDQWGRVVRGLEKVRAVYSGRQGGTASAEDDVLHFFQDVHHLKDWLGSDPATKVTQHDGDMLIDRSLELSLCTDLANGSKHLVLTKKTRTGDPSTAITRNDAGIRLGPGDVQHGFYVRSGGSEYDVLDLAERAVTEWESFLRQRGLLT